MSVICRRNLRTGWHTDIEFVGEHRVFNTCRGFRHADFDRKSVKVFTTDRSFITCRACRALLPFAVCIE